MSFYFGISNFDGVEKFMKYNQYGNHKYHIKFVHNLVLRRDTLFTVHKPDIVRRPVGMTLTSSTHGILSHFILFWVEETPKKEICASHMLGKFFYDVMNIQQYYDVILVDLTSR